MKEETYYLLSSLCWLLQMQQELGNKRAGCGSLTYNFTTALRDVEGARYALNLGFESGMALLENATTTANSTTG